MVVLEENHVEESDAVVHAATNLHSLLLQHTHTWGSLTGIKHTGLGTCINECLLILMRHRGDTRHTLQDIEHQTFCLQKALLLALHAHHDIARHHMGTILHINLHLEFRIETAKHFFGDLNSCEDTLFLDQ